MEVHVGQTLKWQRTLTEDEILRFMELSGDRGVHHREKDASGRLLAHGLLTATLPTKLGGDLDFIARTMTLCRTPRAHGARGRRRLLAASAALRERNP